MIWIIIATVLVITVAIVFTTRRMKVVRAKHELENDVQGVLDSFQNLKTKVNGSNMPAHEKTNVVRNIDMSLATLTRWKQTAIPNITFWKNHTEPIEKEFKDLQTSVQHDLAGYSELEAK